MVYVDTSVMVKLYIREVYSREAADWIVTNNEAIPKTILHELEFTNALYLKQFRNEITKREVGIIFERFSKHQKAGVFYVPSISWPEVFFHSIEISRTHTQTIGSRSLDIMHVASALALNAALFFTFDEKQAQLAAAAGLKLVNFTDKPVRDPSIF